MTISPKSWKALRDRMAEGRLIAYPSIAPSPKHTQLMSDVAQAMKYFFDAEAKRNPPTLPRPNEAIKVWYDEAEHLFKHDRVFIGIDMGTEPATVTWHPKHPDRKGEQGA